MSESSSSPSEAAARLAALIKRSAELATEMKATSEKMQALTEQMARETEQRNTHAADAKERARLKPPR
jgi:hypothetical protein